MLGELVQTTRGEWITHPPTRCPNGHPLGPNQVLVGHQACLGHGGGHTTWTCRTCDQTVYGPPLNTHCTRARWAGDGADFHQSRLTKLLSHDDHDDEHDGGHFQNCRRPVLTSYPMALSPARQRNGVSEGMAFGLVMLNRNELPFTNKMRIDLAFERAWRDWPDRYKSQFKQVSTDLAKGKDAVWVMTDAEKTKRTAAFYWEWDGGTLSIYGRQTDWDGDDPDDIKFAVDVIDGDVPVEGWVMLAREFLNDFDREYGQD